MFDTIESESFRRNAFYKRPDFHKLAELYGMDLSRAEQCLRHFSEREAAVTRLVRPSFLSDEARNDYLRRYHDRLRAIAD